ncbi:hypothetical protein BDN70DRAFT_986167 [Pholiota conissans]|uniref:Uncharacterized protein n=1 Tax=Pholiota conissans TaxID=109636 RepID=A0A9P6CZY4_9AGAR|nr:hypothetical protein BDN70DRAFT_986167 [Pholiota conissans]
MVSTTFKVLAGLWVCMQPVLAITNPVYIITNAEQPSLSRPGLTPVGFKRANECLPALFSTLNIGKIIMCPRNDDSEVCFETLSTTQPTADALGLPIDTSCGADENTDDDCVTDLLKKFAKNSTESVLIVWDIQEIGALLGEDLDLDTDEADADDGIHFDLVTLVVKNKIKGIVSQNCTDIDGIAPGTDTPTKRAFGPSKRSRSAKLRLPEA